MSQRVRRADGCVKHLVAESVSRDKSRRRRRTGYILEYGWTGQRCDSGSPSSRLIPSGAPHTLPGGRQDFEAVGTDGFATVLAPAVGTRADPVQGGTDLVEPDSRPFQLGNQMAAFHCQGRTLRIVLVVGRRVAGRLEYRGQPGRQRFDQRGGSFPFCEERIPRLVVLVRGHRGPTDVVSLRCRRRSESCR